MAAIYPYCVSADVSALNQQRTYNATSKPTLTQVKDFMLRIASQIKAVCNNAGYDVDNFHEYSSSCSDSVSAGSSVDIELLDATDFSTGDLVKIEGKSSGARVWEFAEIITKSSNTITVDTLSNSYDANLTCYIINGALNTLREINAVGAAWKTEQATFFGGSPNQSDHAEALKEEYYGNEENMSGLWAITNIPNFLEGATTDSQSTQKRSFIDSYGIQNENAEDVEPKFEIDSEW